MLFDSHAHLDDPCFDGDRESVIEEIKRLGVTNLVNIGSDIENSMASVRLAEKYDFIYASVGVHPSETTNMTDEDIQKLKDMARHKKVVAIGEIGLDYHYEDTNTELQRKWFRAQLDLAKALNMPVVIHDRESKGECLEILREKELSNGVVHCFSGSAESAKELLNMGLLISFTGVITFKNAKKAINALEVIPMDRLMIETDCPYMAPEPYRGQRNHSGYVIKIAEKIAQVKGLTLEEVTEITANNAKKFFNIY